MDPSQKCWVGGFLFKINSLSLYYGSDYTFFIDNNGLFFY